MNQFKLGVSVNNSTSTTNYWSDSRTYTTNNTTNNTTTNTTTNNLGGICNNNIFFSNTSINAPVTINIQQDLQGQINLLEYKVQQLREGCKRRFFFGEGATPQLIAAKKELRIMKIKKYGILEVQKQEDKYIVDKYIAWIKFQETNKEIMSEKNKQIYLRLKQSYDKGQLNKDKIIKIYQSMGKIQQLKAAISKLEAQ